MTATLPSGIATPDVPRTKALRGTTPPLRNVLLCFAGAERAWDIGVRLSGCLIQVLGNSFLATQMAGLYGWASKLLLRFSLGGFQNGIARRFTEGSRDGPPGNGPRKQDSLPLQSKIVVQMARLVLLHDEGQLFSRRFWVQGTFRLRRSLEIPFVPIPGEAQAICSRSRSACQRPRSGFRNPPAKLSARLG
jgi:hypothetical protein